MKLIELTQGYQAVVDDADYERLNSVSWHYSHGRAVRRSRQGTTWMHHEVLPPTPGMVVDHINADALDNRRDNLQIITQHQNTIKRTTSKGTSGYRGVHFFKATGRYQAHITYQYKRIHLGYFKTREEAAIAYNKTARNLFGRFAVLNLVEEKI